MSILDEGDETLKGALHGATGTLLVLLAWYNWRVWQRRGTAWHLACALAYTVGAVLEPVQIWRHR